MVGKLLQDPICFFLSTYGLHLPHFEPIKTLASAALWDYPPSGRDYTLWVSSPLGAVPSLNKTLLCLHHSPVVRITSFFLDAGHEPGTHQTASEKGVITL